MSFLDSYVDGSIILSSLGKKPKVAAKAIVKKKPVAKKAAPKPPVAQIEQDLGEPGYDESEAEMQAAVDAMEQGGEEDPFGDAGGGGDSGGDSSSSDSGGGGSAAPADAAAAAAPAAATPAAADVPAAPAGSGSMSFDMQTKSRYAGARTATAPTSSPAMNRQLDSSARSSYSAPARTSTVAPAATTRATTLATAAAPVNTATRTSTVSRTATPVSLAPTSRTGMLRTAVRGDDALPFIIASPIPSVSPEAWTRFVIGVRNGVPVGAVSESNELGMFSLKPKRLGDLKLLANVRSVRSPNGRMVWTGDFVPPMSAKRFLSDPSAQYQAFCASMKNYLTKLQSGEIARPDGGKPSGITLSGVLAILHRCGPSGLKTWNNEHDRFPDTIALYGRTNGIF